MDTSGNILVMQVGTTKIHYFPERKIGMGTTSVVYQGYFDDIDIKAAVKEIEKDQLEVYNREVKVFKEIWANRFETSKNVIGLYDWVETSNYFYFCMQKADCNLREFIGQNPNMSQNTQVQITQDIAQGLDFLHEKNILHRDIKPENVLIFQDNSIILAKLGDFGVSRKMTNEAGTQSKGRGTANWMAPEAIIAKHRDTPFQTTKYVDIFSFGMTAHFTFSKGVHPFGHSKEHGKNETMNIIDPNVKPADVSQTKKFYLTDHLLRWMMQKKPENRPTIKQVINHPLFWDSRKRLDFICELSSTVSDKYTVECKQIRDNIEKEYKQFYQKLYNKTLDWVSAVDIRLFQRTGKGNKKYFGDSLFSLVELIRDKDEHFKEMLPNLMRDRFMISNKGVLEYSKKLYMEYFIELFPDIVIFLFCSFVDQNAPYFASFRDNFYRYHDNVDVKVIKSNL